MRKSKFTWLKEPLLLYATNLLKYSEYLIKQKAIIAENQNSLTPIVDEGKAEYIEILDEIHLGNLKLLKSFTFLLML